MQKTFTTNNSAETQKLGKMLAEEMLTDKRFDLSRPKRPEEVEPRNAFIICLSGELGSGKTTFTQGLLKGLRVKGPYTSPTFLVMKQYHITHNIKHKTKRKKSFHASCFMFHDVYHIDAYRVDAKDILNLGWEEIVADKNNVIIVEWADRISGIIPKDALWISFEWVDEKKRKIIFLSRHPERRS